jgi:hypothetical protein
MPTGSAINALPTLQNNIPGEMTTITPEVARLPPLLESPMGSDTEMPMEKPVEKQQKTKKKTKTQTTFELPHNKPTARQKENCKHLLYIKLPQSHPTSLTTV